MLHLLLAILINAVPIYGVVALGWSAPTVLVLFWCENFFGMLVNALRIRLHARVSRRRGHFRYEAASGGKAGGGTYLSNFLGLTLVFTLAHGFFVGMIVLMMHTNRGAESALWRFDSEAFRIGLFALLAFLLIDLAVDLPGLSKRPFAWIERVSGAKIARVLILHCGIIFGMMAMMSFENPLTMLVVLMALKSMVDALMAWGRQNPKMSEKPPRWLKKIAPKGKDGEDLDAWWLAEQRKEEARLRRNEEIVPP